MKLYLVFVLIVSGFTYSQTKNYSIEYSYTMIDVKNEFESHPSTQLIGNTNQSIFIVDHRNASVSSNPEVMYTTIANVNSTFSDYKTNKIYFKENVNLTYFDIEDKIYDFNWTLIDEQKTILGYQCFKAETTFRGRKFEVFYTPEIAISHGPLKLNGLPGIILEVYSKDEVAMLHLVAKNINTNLKFEELANHYKDKKTISYQKFIEIYRKKYIESLNIIDEFGNTSPLIKGFQEYFITD